MVKLSPGLNSTEWSASRSSGFTPRYPIVQEPRLVPEQRYGEEKNHLPLPRIEVQLFGRPAPYPLAIPALVNVVHQASFTVHSLFRWCYFWREHFCGSFYDAANSYSVE
jgi:hypothetical protein